jgi:hypothetical protein
MHILSSTCMHAASRSLAYHLCPAQLLDYPGRPSLATLDNNTRNPKAALLEHLPPLQTRPHNIGDSSSSRGGSSSSATQQLAAAWDEELCVDVPPEALAASDALLLLEIVQLPGGFERYKVSPRRRDACAFA